MSFTKFLQDREKNHPVYDPKQDYVVEGDKILVWLKDGGDSPLPMWPKLKKEKKS